jgi:hypothetical protein
MKEKSEKKKVLFLYRKPEAEKCSVDCVKTEMTERL